MKSQTDEKKILQFERQLQGVFKRNSFVCDKSFGLKEQRILKQKLLRKIKYIPEDERFADDLYLLTQSIRKAVSVIKLSAQKKAYMKEKILNVVEMPIAQPMFGNWRFTRISRYFKVAFASSLLFCFAMTSIFFMPLLQVQVILAAHSTYIQEVYGQVFIHRDGQVVTAKTDFSLKEGDVIETGEKSFVTVRFFDDSTSRLGQNTKLEVKKLYHEPFQDISSEVEVLLNEGRLWTRVLNLIDEHSSFTVDTNQASITATKKAAFDVQAHSNNSTLSVFDNVVDFVPKDAAKAQRKPVVAGFQADFSPANSNTVIVSPLKKDDSDQSVSELWVQSNLERDKVHAESVMSETENDLNSNVDGNDESLQTDVLGIGGDDEKPFTDPVFEEQRQSFLRNYHALLLGETFLVRKQGVEGMKLVLQFRNAIRTFMIRFPGFVAADPLNAAVLHSMAVKRVAQQQKDLATFLPGDSLYPVKEVLEETELLLNPDEIDSTFIRLSQAERKLLEIQDLVAENNLDMANRVFIRYQHQIDEIVLQLKNDRLDQLRGKLAVIFSQQVDQIKALTALEESLITLGNNDFLSAVRKVRYTILDKLIGALQVLPAAVPLNLVMELNDLLQIYLKENVRDEGFVVKMNNLLLLGDRIVSSSQAKLPQKLGIVTIVEGQATPVVEDLN